MSGQHFDICILRALFVMFRNIENEFKAICDPCV